VKIARVVDPDTGNALQAKLNEDGLLKTKKGTFNLEEVELLPPVKPGKIICVGLNYADHADETGAELPKRPSLFFKPPSSVIGPDDPIVIMKGKRYDPEGEVALVMGDKCRDVEKDEALNYILGFTGLNDVTNRDAQNWEQNWVRAKGFDTAAPIGPYILPVEEAELPLSFQLSVNGNIRQSSDTSDLIFGIRELVAEISSFMTLNKGDIISTGTPKGVSPIEDGDEVSLTIEGIGSLENEVTY
jgi:2-keto-4-pentenoate hydratase/2-oxohepta-3-ene-1,7-dioic acid hydratase in catechol pathway